MKHHRGRSRREQLARHRIEDVAIETDLHGAENNGRHRQLSNNSAAVNGHFAAAIPSSASMNAALLLLLATLDQYQVAVDDPFRWMEDLRSPELAAWIGRQNVATRTRLENEPAYEPVRRRIEELTRARRTFPPVARGSMLFVAEGNPNAENASTLEVIDTRTGKSRTLINETLPGDEQPDLIRIGSGSIFPSHDGKYVLFRTRKGSSSWNVLRVVETRTGRMLTDRIEGFAGGLSGAAWDREGTGFFYSRFDRNSGVSELEERREFHRLYHHRLGDSQAKDRLIAEAPEEPQRWFYPRVTDDGTTLLVSSGVGTAQDNRILSGPATRDTTLRDLFAGRVTSWSYSGSSEDALYFLTTEHSPRGEIVRLDRQTATTTTVAPPSPDAILYADVVGNRLIVFANREAMPRVTIHALDGKEERVVALPRLATIWGPGSGGSGFVGRSGDRFAYFLTNGLSDPGTVHRLDPATGQLEVWKKSGANIDPASFRAEQVFFTSRDGTRVPMLLAWRGDLDRTRPHPVWMYAYGALGWPAFPWYQPHIVAWMERGGIYALPGIRGGGEYGAEWHDAGRLANRDNSIEDFLSAAEWLVAQGVTTRKMLISNGGSISGALEAEALVLRPDLFAGAVIDIPVTDLMRYHHFTGANMWVPEWGSADDPKQAAVLLRHSPYHLIRPGRCYPPTLVTAGREDQTAVPWHAYKFVAALQRAQSCPESPVLLDALEGTGHTFGATPEQTAATWARQIAFAESATRAEASKPAVSARLRNPPRWSAAPR